MESKDNQQEAHWIHAAAQGNTVAFEKLIMLYEKKIYNICLRLLNKPDDAYDATQEVCIKIWKQLKNFRGESKFSTWIYRIATNTCLDLLRQQKRRQEEILLLIDDETKGEEINTCRILDWEDLSTQLLEKEGMDILWQAIGALKEEHRIIIILRDIEGYSYEEIATALDLSIGTVKSRLSRARMGLKKILEQNKEPYCSFFRHK